jgi:hypothetical protein
MADLSNQDLGLSFYENLAKRDTIMPTTSTNHLYYGDNFTILREHIRDESINLIYLDPELEMLRGSKRNLANNV